jgi:DNA-binding response OmpR family regulator
MKILIIEDEKDIALPLKDILEDRGFAVDYSEDGIDGLKMVELNEYDCILLDLNLPKLDGIDVSKRIRKTKTVPIIMVTARIHKPQKIEGFEYGADDYVTKPFDIDELVMRIKAVIKRNSRNSRQELRVGNIKLSADENLVFMNKKKIELTNKETGMLEYLIRNKGKIVSAEEFLEHVWDREVDLFSSTVKTHIKTLRRKIDPDKKLITTVKGKGYRIQ